MEEANVVEQSPLELMYMNYLNGGLSKWKKNIFLSKNSRGFTNVRRGQLKDELAATIIRLDTEITRLEYIFSVSYSVDSEGRGEYYKSMPNAEALTAAYDELTKNT